MASQVIFRRLLLQTVRANSRLVSTSKKTNDTAAADVTKQCEPQAQTQAKVEHKNWVNYGFDIHNKEDDRRAMHSTLFATITLCLVFGTFYFMYLPDYGLRDWSQREAFLELRRREKAGLPLVDANYVNPATINLPSDEELGDTEIII